MGANREAAGSVKALRGEGGDYLDHLVASIPNVIKPQI